VFPVWQDLQLKQYKEQFEREHREAYNNRISIYKELLELNPLARFIKQ